MSNLLFFPSLAIWVNNKGIWKDLVVCVHHIRTHPNLDLNEGIMIGAVVCFRCFMKVTYTRT